MENSQKDLEKYRFEFRKYRRKFKQVLFTHHGSWDVREGIIIRLTDEIGIVSWGEIAPISWFGSETLEQAFDFCQNLLQEITTKTIFTIPTELPACQFGFESAWEMANGKEEKDKKLPDFPLSYSHLLPTGKLALHGWQTPWEQGSRTFKLKIGVANIDEEITIFNQLIQALPASTQLRLDANGGLNQQQAHQWLKIADEVKIVEFLEQPLPPAQFDEMLAMSRQYSTPIALDESVATLNQLEACYLRGWRAIFVIKVAIAGSPKRLRQFCQEHEIDAVFSSVFESAIARHAALQLALELSQTHRAVGFGVNHWFNEDDETWLEQLWQKY